MSFKNRVKRFWEWFEEEEAQIINLINGRESEGIISLLDERLKDPFGSIAFEIGGNVENERLELALSPAGNKTKQFLASYWKENAPELPRWDIYAYKPPLTLKGFSLGFDGDKYSAEDFWVSYLTDPEAQKIDLRIYSEKLQYNDDPDRIVFIMLDTCLGENNVELWVGNVDFADTMDDTFTHRLDEFIEKFDNILEDEGWDPDTCPEDRVVGYKLDAAYEGCFLRGDVIAGYTHHIDLVNEYFSQEGGESEIFDEAENSGATIGFIYFPVGNRDRQTLVDYRGEIEDEINDLLRIKGLGYIIGGASGTENLYIDFLFTDSVNAIESLRDYFDRRGEPRAVWYAPFSRDKEPIRII